MVTMTLEGLEMIAVLVVVVLFVKVLDRFGLLPLSYDGKDAPTSGRLVAVDHLLLKLLVVASSSSSISLMLVNSTPQAAFCLAASHG